MTIYRTSFTAHLRCPLALHSAGSLHPVKVSPVQRGQMQEVRLRRQGGRIHELPPHPPLPQERHQHSHQVEERYADVSLGL
jgi:hypothetical protein